MTNLVKKLRKPIFTDQDGNQWRHYSYERDSFGLTAIYQSVEDPELFHEIDVDFVSQQGETYENGIETYEIYPGTDGYDYSRAVVDALDEAHGQIRERRAA